MDIEGVVNKEILWVLRVLKILSFFDVRNTDVTFDFQENYDVGEDKVKSPSVENRERIIKLLVDKKAISVLDRIYATKGLLKTMETFEAEMRGDSPRKVVVLLIRPKFDELLTKYESISNGLSESVERKVIFHKDKLLFEYGSQFCEIPASSKISRLCEVLSEYPIKQLIDWSEIYEKMTGEEIMGGAEAKKAKKIFYDTVRALNKRMEKNFHINKYISWQRKTVKRNF